MFASEPEMSLVEALRQRHCVRAFLPNRPVSKQLLQQALTLAQWSPSNCNAQPWRVYVAGGEACDRIRARLVEQVGTCAPVAENPTPPFGGTERKRQVACAVGYYSELGISREDKAGRARAALRNFELFDAPCLLVIGMDSSLGTGVALDVGIYLQSLMLALHALGLGSCPQASLRCYPEVLREEMGIEGGVQILVGLSVGYEADVAINAFRPGRASIGENVTFHGF